MNRPLKLAYFSPLNPIQSGISDYSEELLPALAPYAELDLFVDGFTPANRSIAGRFPVRPARQFHKLAGRYDTYLFHMGNSAAHAYIYQALQASSGQGVLVLHDFVLHHFLIGQYLNRGQAAQYVRQMARRYGTEGEMAAREVIKGKLAETLFNYPLNETAIESARAVLVHSRFARDQIVRQFPAKPVGLVRMGVPLPPLSKRAEARARLRLPPDEFIVVSLGHLNPYKRLDSALWAYRAFRREFPASRFVLVGSPSPNYDVKAMISALGLENNVQLTGYASGQDAGDYLAAADCCVNLRYPTAGETSASLLRIMGAGRPVLVSRTGAFEELPDDSCIKVDIDDAEEELLLEYLLLLARRPEIGQALGRNARRHVALHARPEDAAYDYYLFLCKVLGRRPEIAPPPPPEYNQESLLPESYPGQLPGSLLPAAAPASGQPVLLSELAQAMADIGLVEDDPLLEDIARAARFSGLLKS